MNQQSPDLPSGQGLLSKTWLRVLVFLICFLIVNMVMQLGAIYLLSFIEGQSFQQYLTTFQNQVANGEISIGSMIVFQLAGLLGMLSLVALFRYRVDRKSIVSLGFKIKGYYKDSVIGFVLGIMLIGLGFISLYIGGMLSIESTRFPLGSVALSFLFFLIVSLNEEIMLRGYVMKNLLEKYHPYNALGVTAFLFSIMHGFNMNITLIGFLNIFLAGVLFGIYYIYRQNLWFPIMIHLSWNFFQGPVFGFEVSGIASVSIIQQSIEGPDFLTGGSFGFEGSLLLTVFLVLAILWIYRRYAPLAPNPQ